jgi:hypothetical protein
MPARLRTDPNRQQKRRKQLLPYALNTWCPCGMGGCTHKRCDGLMTDPARMQLDHTIPVVLGGGEVPGDRIICAHCNQSAGATLGNQLRGNRASRDW